MSWSLSTPMMPSLTPRAADPLWFSVDKPRDEETELTREEAEHNAVRSGHIESKVLMLISRLWRGLLTRGRI